MLCAVLPLCLFPYGLFEKNCKFVKQAHKSLSVHYSKHHFFKQLIGYAPIYLLEVSESAYFGVSPSRYRSEYHYHPNRQVVHC